RVAGGGAWLSVACVVGLLIEPYAPGNASRLSHVRDGLNLLSDVSLLPLPAAIWLHDTERRARSSYRTLALGESSVVVWVAADLLSAFGRASESTLLGAIASGLLAAWIFLASWR